MLIYKLFPFVDPFEYDIVMYYVGPVFFTYMLQQ